VQESQRIRGVVATLNATFLTLIPKDDKATHPNKFRPISLCNVIYKIISKVIDLWLKPLLPSLVAPQQGGYVEGREQGGYVEGREILDNTLLVHEVAHSLKTTKTPGMLIKLDISKVFGKLNWLYIKEILLTFDFYMD
jgi:hypothetical protein